MGTILKVSLLLGVAAILIPSAFGFKCVVCGGALINKQICEEYKKGDHVYEWPCYVFGGNKDPACVTNTTNGIETKGCVHRSGLAMGCKKEGVSEICYCDHHLCNRPGLGSGQLKGSSFGILGMVLLGGVGGQLWGQESRHQKPTESSSNLKSFNYNNMECSIC